MSDRIIFANTLRGFAAISVLLSHFAGIFWVMNPLICHLLGVPKLTNLPEIPKVLSFFANHCIILGQFGVGVFFIVSGLVIPFSLKNSSNKIFLYRRALRIYPVYIAGFSFTMVMLYVLAAYKHSTYNFSLFDILAHFGVITRAPLGVSRIDGISWTLEVEIYFYLALCVLGARTMQLDFRRYIIAILVISLLAALTFRLKDYLVGVQMASGLMLLLGMTYYSLLNNKVSTAQFWIIQLLVCSLIPILWLLVATPAGYTYQWMSGYLLAIAAFHICYLLRNRFTNNKLLSHFADISYPLYVVHALFGYAIMYVLVEKGAGALTAIAAASLTSYLAALSIHLVIEKPSLRWSKLMRHNPITI
ncbi:acyltransferase family protein [Pseudomonas sp. 5P_5.1_Bac1]|uniref:acyltransferase family protein n=1 Tax=Pseudomonas sp. 5P_5.1_Bac1 TaxID=2971616 RepID=UPI0021C67367|nr:acyltransferase [Pseudomonas sp. 5P_5.1_Bac1]MCU1722237.1 acyltransferase [Pseudomonas sp. 5P_5.1_Bac1]